MSGNQGPVSGSGDRVRFISGTSVSGLRLLKTNAGSRVGLR